MIHSITPSNTDNSPIRCSDDEMARPIRTQRYDSALCHANRGRGSVPPSLARVAAQSKRLDCVPPPNAVSKAEAKASASVFATVPHAKAPVLCKMNTKRAPMSPQKKRLTLSAQVHTNFKLNLGQKARNRRRGGSNPKTLESSSLNRALLRGAGAFGVRKFEKQGLFTLVAKALPGPNAVMAPPAQTT
mmetsp:Transcript_78701/g.218631  ORF Transcript_78701/g.218631 Transcript_78701/m.218631 type:complete len:188 (+) Transcript_78701:548-1111(+)